MIYQKPDSSQDRDPRFEKFFEKKEQILKKRAKEIRRYKRQKMHLILVLVLLAYGAFTMLTDVGLGAFMACSWGMVAIVIYGLRKSTRMRIRNFNNILSALGVQYKDEFMKIHGTNNSGGNVEWGHIDNSNFGNFGGWDDDSDDCGCDFDGGDSDCGGFDGGDCDGGDD